MDAPFQLFRTPCRSTTLVVARESGQEAAPVADVAFRLDDYEAVREVVREVARTGGSRYLRAADRVLRIQLLLDGELSLHWLHRPESWASLYADDVEAWPASIEAVPSRVLPGYASVPDELLPPPIDAEVPCPCGQLPERAEVTPQAVWTPLSAPFDATSLADWARSVELYRCSHCEAVWAATQVPDGLRLHYESRRLTAGALASLQDAAAAALRSVH